MNKEVPNDISAEQAVIGSMFLSKYALDKSLEALTSDSFYLEKHGKIFNAIKELHSKGTALDITTITSHLKDKNIINEVGGVDYITEILEQTPTAANIDHYLKIVEDKSVLRSLIEEATQIATMGYQNELSVTETLDKAEAKILNVVKNRKSSEFKQMPEVLK